MTAKKAQVMHECTKCGYMQARRQNRINLESRYYKANHEYSGSIKYQEFECVKCRYVDVEFNRWQ